MSWMNEYPRPQLRRDSFLCLNGEWELMPESTIRVPFPPQSPLGAWKPAYDGEKTPVTLEYRRTFTLPEGFVRPGERVRLHVGAADVFASVYVNCKFVGSHRGGYLPFWYDVTDALQDGENAVSISVWDGNDRSMPYGKQHPKPHGMWYTPVSGIWQSVWLEAVPEQCIESLTITPGLDSVTVCVSGGEIECRIEVDGLEPAEAVRGIPKTIPVPQPHLWTPEDPYLYHFSVISGSDTVHSYFALRSVESRDGRVLLNGKPVFLNGVLDQGYYPDGIYLPGDPEEYERDVLRMKELGFNLLRKHIKVEPETFYYACDRLGMLVMQDMVNNGRYSFLMDTALPTIGLKWRPDHWPWRKRQAEIFLQHSLDITQHLYNHPCIIAWTIFNEGWGQAYADRMYDTLKKADPTRLWDATSGWFHQRKSDFQSEHIYFRNKRLKARGHRPLLLSECGGYVRKIDGHLFKPDAKYGYGSAETEEALTEKIAQLYEEMVLPSIPEGLCGVIYTQLSDVETEINGLYTYDRQVCKVNPQRMREVLRKAAAALEENAKHNGT